MFCLLKKCFYAIVFISTLSSCSSIFAPVKTEATTSYVLNPPVKVVQEQHISNDTVWVMPPETSDVYATKQMAYSIVPHQVAYFAKNFWVDTPVHMLHPLIVQALQKTHYFDAVIEKPALAHYDFILYTQLQQLQQDFLPHGKSIERLVMRVQLVNAINNQVVATQQISMAEEAKPTPYGGVTAANKATAKMLNGLAKFSIRMVRDDEE